MLRVRLTAQGKIIKLPPVQPGESGSMTDLTDNTLLIFTCDLDGAVAAVYRSLAGTHVDLGDKRVIDSHQTKLLSLLRAGDAFELDITTPYGETRVAFRLQPPRTH